MTRCDACGGPLPDPPVPDCPSLCATCSAVIDRQTDEAAERRFVWGPGDVEVDRVSRWRWRRRTSDRRVRLADDVRRLAGWSHLILAEARRLGAEVPDGVTACSLVWSHWADRLAVWAKGSQP